MYLPLPAWVCHRDMLIYLAIFKIKKGTANQNVINWTLCTLSASYRDLFEGNNFKSDNKRPGGFVIILSWSSPQITSPPSVLSMTISFISPDQFNIYLLKLSYPNIFRLFTYFVGLLPLVSMHKHSQLPCWLFLCDPINRVYFNVPITPFSPVVTKIHQQIRWRWNGMA